jgi:aconitate hydratase
MEPRFLNVRVILAQELCPHTRDQPKKQGMVALTFVNKDDYDKVREDDRISVTGFRAFAPGSLFTVTLKHSDGTQESFEVEHTYNEAQIGWFRAGSALNDSK